MSLKTESDHSDLTFVDETQFDHSHGTKNKTKIMTTKQNKIESIKIMNLNCVIF